MAAEAVSATLTKYINPMKGWQPRHVELDTASGLFTTCHVDSLGIPERATTTIVDIRGATVQLEDQAPEFTVACVDGAKVSLRCENGQERTFWVSMLNGVGVREGPPPGGGGGGGGSGGGLMSMGSGFLSRGKAAAAKAAEQVSRGDLMDNAYKISQKAAAVAKSATFSTHDIGGMQIQLGAQLAEGGYSFVHFAEEAGTGRQFAVKRIVMMGGEANRNAKWEVDVLRKLQGHPNIMKLFSHGTMRLKRDGCTEMLMVCELCDGGHLYDFYQKTGGNIPEDKLIDIFSQCCEGVRHLHSQEPPLAHRDIKIENFLLQGDTVKLCDFGSCTAGGKVYESRKEILDEEETIQKYSTMMYRAPEMVDLYSGQLVCELVDVWALGCVLFTLAYGKHPFGDAGTLHILSGKYTIPDTQKYSNRIPSIVAFMLVKVVAERPPVSQCLEYIRTGKANVGKKSSGAPQPSGTAPAQRGRKASNDDDFDPRHAAAPPAASQPRSRGASRATASAGGGGGNALFGMLEWQDDGQGGEPEPAPPSAAAPTATASSSAFGAGGDADAFEVNFDDSFASAPTPAPVPSKSGGGNSGGNALFGMLEWEEDAGSLPAQAATPTPGGTGAGTSAAPLQLSGGGEFKPSFDDAFTDSAAPSPPAAPAGSTDDFFSSDPFAAPSPQPPAAMLSSSAPPAAAAADDFFGGDPFVSTSPVPSVSSQSGGASPSADDFFGGSAAPAPTLAPATAGQQPGTMMQQPMAAMVPMATMTSTTSASASSAPQVGAQPARTSSAGSAFDSLTWS